MKKKNVLNSPRLTKLKNERRRSLLSKFLFSMLGIIALFSLAAYLSRLSNLNINEVEVSGNQIIETDGIKTAAENVLAGKYLWLFPKTNILFYPQNALRSALENKFNRLKDINFSIKNNHILEISVGERVPAYTWCGTDIDLSGDGLRASNTPGNCYFLDDNGYVFDEAPYFSGEVYFKFYGETAGANGAPASNPLGSYFSPSNFNQLITFKNVLTSLGLKPVALYLASNGDINIFLSPGSAASVYPRIILRTDSDLENVAENLQAALGTEPLLSKFKNNYSSLQYIDLRFGNRVYDKFSAKGGSASGGQ